MRASQTMSHKVSRTVAFRVTLEEYDRIEMMADQDMLFSNVLSADRIQSALNKWKVEKLGDVYYRFCDLDDPDLALILRAFDIRIPSKCFKISEIKQLKSDASLSL